LRYAPVLMGAEAVRGGSEARGAIGGGVQAGHTQITKTILQCESGEKTRGRGGGVVLASSSGSKKAKLHGTTEIKEGLKIIRNNLKMLAGKVFGERQDTNSQTIRKQTRRNVHQAGVC